MAQVQDTVNTAQGILVRAAAGAATVQAVGDVDLHQIQSIGQLVLQLVIGIVTLVGIIRKSKQPTIVVQKQGETIEEAATRVVQ